MLLNKLPDIDIDFAHDRKDDVIDLIFAKYGGSTPRLWADFSTCQARSAIGDVAKVLGVSEYQIRRFTEHIPHSRPQDISAAIAERQECRDLPIQEEPYATALKMAAFLDGFPRYPKMHPCGLVISRGPMTDLTPCFISNKGYPTTHFDMEAVESIGLIKMDILAQGGLAVMRDVQQMLSAGRAVDKVDQHAVAANGQNVAQVSQPAVSPISNRPRVRSQKAGLNSRRPQAGSPATQQVGKPALRLCRFWPPVNSALRNPTPSPLRPLTCAAWSRGRTRRFGK